MWSSDGQAVMERQSGHDDDPASTLMDPMELPSVHPPESDDEDEEAETAPPACGMCLMYHVLTRLALNVFWILFLPFKLAESWLLGIPVVAVVQALWLNPRLTAAGVVVGFFSGYGFFAPLASVSEAHFRASCTAYLSVLAWLVGQLLVCALVGRGLVMRSVVKEFGMSSANCKLVLSLGYCGYLGLLLGLLVSFGSVAFRETPDDSWEWCRASDIVPAEFVYLAMLTVSIVLALVYVPHKMWLAPLVVLQSPSDQTQQRILPNVQRQRARVWM